MIRGIVGAVLGMILAFILDYIGVDLYVINFLQPYLTFELNLYHFYGLFGIFGAVAGFLPW